MVSSEHHPLEVPPEAFNRVGGNSFLIGKLTFGVIDEVVVVAVFLQVIEALGFVREYLCVISHKLPYIEL